MSIQVNLSLDEILKNVCSDCQTKIQKMISDEVAEQLSKQAKEEK